MSKNSNGQGKDYTTITVNKVRAAFNRTAYANKILSIKPIIFKSSMWVKPPIIISNIFKGGPVKNMPWKKRQKELARLIYKDPCLQFGYIFYEIDHNPGFYSEEFVEIFNILKVFRNKKLCDKIYLRQCWKHGRKKKCKTCAKYLKTKTVWELRDEWNNRNRRNPNWGRR